MEFIGRKEEIALLWTTMKDVVTLNRDGDDLCSLEGMK